MSNPNPDIEIATYLKNIVVVGWAVPTVSSAIIIWWAKPTLLLNETGWNKTRAAEILKVSYKTLLTKIKEYGLEE